MRAPGRDVQHLMPGRRQRGDQRTAIAARALHADHRLAGGVIGQPAEQMPIALGTVGEQQRAAFAAALIDQRGGVGVFVDIDADEHDGLLARG